MATHYSIENQWNTHVIFRKGFAVQRINTKYAYLFTET